MRGITRSQRLLVALVGAICVGTTACGEPPTRAEFVDQMIAHSATDSGPEEGWTEIWGCIYDKLDGDDSIGRLMDLEQGERPPQALSAEVSKLILECSPVTTLPGTGGPAPNVIVGSSGTTIPASSPTTTAPT